MFFDFQRCDARFKRPSLGNTWLQSVWTTLNCRFPVTRWWWFSGMEPEWHTFIIRLLLWRWKINLPRPRQCSWAMMATPGWWRCAALAASGQDSDCLSLPGCKNLDHRTPDDPRQEFSLGISWMCRIIPQLFSAWCSFRWLTAHWWRACWWRSSVFQWKWRRRSNSKGASRNLTEPWPLWPPKSTPVSKKTKLLSVWLKNPANGSSFFLLWSNKVNTSWQLM